MEQLNLVNEWWLQLDPLYQKEIPKKKMSQFLFQKQLLKKELEFERFIKITLGDDAEMQEGMFKKSQFFKVFTKAILKGAVANLQHFASENRSRIGFQDVPTPLKILKFQRNILIGGIQDKKEVMGIDCNGVINSLS